VPPKVARTSTVHHGRSNLVRVAGLSVGVAGVVLELGGYRIDCQSMSFRELGRAVGRYRSTVLDSSARKYCQHLTSLNSQISLGVLTVGQSVLQRVDTVEDNGTCREDRLEREFPSRAFQSRNEIQSRYSIRIDIIWAKGKVEYAYRQRRRGSWGQLLVQCVSQSNPSAAPRGRWGTFCDPRITYPGGRGTSFRGETW
jgi:hypothetical protein